MISAARRRAETGKRDCGQAQFSVEKPDPQDVVSYAASRLKMMSKIGDIASNGGDGGI